MVGAGHALRRFGRTSVQAAKDCHMVPERFERLEAKLKVRRCPFLVGNPITGRHAVTHKQAGKSWLGGGRRLSGGSRRRHHRFEKWQRERSACASQNGSSGNVFFSDKHVDTSVVSEPRAVDWQRVSSCSFETQNS